MKNKKNISKYSIIFFAYLYMSNSAHSNHAIISSLIINNYDTNIYFTKDDNGLVKAKSALRKQNDKFYHTTGGVTENPNDLLDFFISISDANNTHSDFSNLGLIIKSNTDNPICSKVQFLIKKNKIVVKQNDIELTTATSCNYNVFNSINEKIASFRVILNKTFKYWCNQTNEKSETYKTARAIAPNCNVNDFLYNIILNNKGISDLSPLTGFIYISRIDLSENKIKDLPIGIFDKFYNLYWLVLNKNKITSLQNGLFDKNKRLEMFWINNNKISKIGENLFEKNTKLNWISLGNNAILNDSLVTNVFDKIPYLNSLALNGNLLTKVPKAIYKSKMLISLDLSMNQISEIPFEFSKLKNLVHISLHNNNIENLPAWMFSPSWVLAHPNFYYLYLGNNKITSLPEEALNDTRYLLKVDLQGNPILPVITNNTY